MLQLTASCTITDGVFSHSTSVFTILELENSHSFTIAYCLYLHQFSEQSLTYLLVNPLINAPQGAVQYFPK
jgi:hypothetical protein